MTGQIISIDFDGVLIKKIFGHDWKKQKKAKEEEKGQCFTAVNLVDQFWVRLNHLWRGPIRGSIDGIKFLKDNGFKLILITSRNGYHRQTTIWWLKKYKIYHLFDQLLFNDHCVSAIDSKITNISQINPDYHIDDNLDTLNYLSHTSPDTKLIYLGTRTPPKPILRAASWQEIKTILSR